MKSCGRVIIDLAAVVSNWQLMKHTVGEWCEVSAVIKDDAYGLGAKPIAEALYAAGCKTFFFITPEEALDALSGLPQDVIAIILGGVRVGNEALYRDNNLIPVIHSFETLYRWLDQIDKQGTRPIALKFDTGMSRLGFSIDEIPRLMNEYHHLNPFYILSHLACADSPSHELNEKQLNCFSQIKQSLASLFTTAKYSLANSSGIFLGANWHFDLVRPGAGLYGIAPNNQNLHCFKNAVSIELPILQVKQFPTEVSVGYGSTSTVAPNSVLGVIAGGYADGLNRVVGREAKAICNGYEITSVGRMSMDSMVFDLSNIPSFAQPKPGDYIRLVDSDTLTLNYWMKQTNSLGYEILTALGSRLERVYINSDV